MPDGFHVDPAALNSGAAEISELVSGVQNLDIVGISANSDSYGHAGLAGSFTSFCGAWQVASSLLAQRANSAAQALRDSARQYSNTDQTGQVRLHGQESDLPSSPSFGVP